MGSEEGDQDSKDLGDEGPRVGKQYALMETRDLTPTCFHLVLSMG